MTELLNGCISFVSQNALTKSPHVGPDIITTKR